MANGYEPGDYLGQFLQQLPQIYQARQNAQLQRERFEYYKGKDAAAAAEAKRKEAYNQNVRTWTQMQNFAQEMPFGQQANFLRKQLDTLPQDFIESQNLDKFIDNYSVIEENEVNQRGIFDNIMDEDNPEKIRFSIDYLEDPRRKKQALSQAKKLESEYGKQKPFDINKLTLKEQTDYKTYSKLLNDSRAALAQMSLPGLSEEQKREYKKSLPYQEALKNVPFLQAQLDPLIKKGAPITMPEFNYSPESLKALTDDPDLMSSFLAAPEDDMDAFYNAYKNPDPTPTPTPTPTPVVSEASTVSSVPEISLESRFESILTRLAEFKTFQATLHADVKVLRREVTRQMREASKRRRRRPATADDATKAPRAPSGFAKPTLISDDLCAFLGKPSGTEMARTEVTKSITAYIKEHSLQNAENKRRIMPDTALASLLNVDDTVELTYFNLQKYMKVHFPKSAASAPSSA